MSFNRLNFSTEYRLTAYEIWRKRELVIIAIITMSSVHFHYLMSHSLLNPNAKLACLRLYPTGITLTALTPAPGIWIFYSHRVAASIMVYAFQPSAWIFRSAHSHSQWHAVENVSCWSGLFRIIHLGFRLQFCEW